MDPYGNFIVKAANGDDYEAEFKFLEASYSNDVDSLQTADGVVSPRSSPQTFLLAKRPSAAMSEKKRLSFAGYRFTEIGQIFHNKYTLL